MWLIWGKIWCLKICSHDKLYAFSIFTIEESYFLEGSEFPHIYFTNKPTWDVTFKVAFLSIYLYVGYFICLFKKHRCLYWNLCKAPVSRQHCPIEFPVTTEMFCLHCLGWRLPAQGAIRHLKWATGIKPICFNLNSHMSIGCRAEQQDNHAHWYKWCYRIPLFLNSMLKLFLPQFIHFRFSLDFPSLVYKGLVFPHFFLPPASVCLQDEN